MWQNQCIDNDYAYRDLTGFIFQNGSSSVVNIFDGSFEMICKWEIGLALKSSIDILLKLNFL